MPDMRELPRGDVMARGNKVAHSCDAVMGRAHTNPILNTRMCQVEFTGDEVTELTSNIMAESMYAQCNSDGNEYVLL